VTRLRHLWPRPTVRLRLTLWYASIFLLAGTVMLAVAYVIVSRSLTAYYNQTEAETLRGIQRLERSGRLPPVRSVTVPVPEGSREGRRIALEERVRDRAEADAKADQRRRVATQFALALGATTLLSLGGGWLVAGRALRPVAEITAAARSVTGGRLDRRIGLAGPRDELKELADTFDEMLARLDAAFASQRRFVANAAHELRTPLALVKAAVDVTLDDPRALSSAARMRAMADTVREGIDRSERLTESLLTLATSDRGLDRSEPADLARLARSAAAEATRDDAARQLSFTWRLDAAPVLGDPVLLERMIANLLANAARYNVPDGFVEFATGRRNGHAFVRVVNSGPVVPDEEVPGLTQPFRRARRDRAPADGVGLGLSIVDSVARAHGGRLELAARLDGGLAATVRLPSPPARAT
jgi:signal transduction histidine kinase